MAELKKDEDPGSFGETLEQSASCKTEYPAQNLFIVPGDEPVSAALDLARTVVRRAERRVVDLYTEQGTVDPLIAEYLNKLSTFVYLIELSVILSEG